MRALYGTLDKCEEEFFRTSTSSTTATQLGTANIIHIRVNLRE